MSFIDDLLGNQNTSAKNIYGLTEQETAIKIQQLIEQFKAQNAAEEATRRQNEAAAAQQAEQQRQQQEAASKQQADQQAVQRAAAERQRQEAEAAAKRAADVELAKKTAAEQKARELLDLRNAASGSARSGVQTYFQNRGADPSKFGTQIDDVINQALSGVPQDDPSPSSYLDPTALGSGLYGNLETARRGQVQGELNQLFPTGYSSNRVASTLDDPTLNALEGEQYNSAKAVIDNMLKRGVITPTGATGGYAALEKQRPGVMSNLNTVGTDVLATGRGKLDDIVNRAMSGASTLSLGGGFDPNSFKSEADTAFDSFINELPGTIRKSAPGNLFNTGALAAAAGAAQGRQNTKYDPDALSGVLDTGSPDQYSATGTKRKKSSVEAPTYF